jgi:capsular polysaccharide biosynthesis protein
MPAGKQYFHVFNIWGTGYHHWVTEVLPKLILFRSEIRNGEIILPPNPPSFVFDCLGVLQMENFIELKGNTYFSELSIISNPNSGHFNPNHIIPVRNTAFEAVGVSTTNRSRRIYVSREYSRGRKVVNEKEVQDFLQKEGFEIVHLENASFREQVQMFAETEILVSIHGAALTNLIFMPPAGRVIELYPSGFTSRDFFNACYKRLSHTVGVEHCYVFCRRQHESKPFDLHNDNIIVDTIRLHSVL